MLVAAVAAVTTIDQEVYVFGTHEEFHLPAITRRAQRRCVGDFAQLRSDAGSLHFTLEKMSQPDELGGLWEESERTDGHDDDAEDQVTDDPAE